MDNLILEFRNALDFLIEESGKSVVELSEDMRVNKYVIYKWRKRSADIKLKSLLTIADYFHCPIDFLCDKEDRKLSFLPQRCPAFKDQIIKVFEENNISLSEIIKKTSIKPAQYYNWLKGVEPMLISLYNLSDFIGISIDELVGRKP